MNLDNFWYSGVLLLILGIFVTLYAVFNGVIYDALGNDVKNHFKEHFSTYFYVCVALVAVLSILAFFYTNTIGSILSRLLKYDVEDETYPSILYYSCEKRVLEYEILYEHYHFFL